MNLFHLKNSFVGLGNEDVDLNKPDWFGAFIGHLSAKIFLLLLIAQFLQHILEHLGDISSFTSIILELVNITVWKTNSWGSSFSFWLHGDIHNHMGCSSVTTGVLGNVMEVCHLQEIRDIRKERNGYANQNRSAKKSKRVGEDE
jgi:hypothetical protein